MVSSYDDIYSKFLGLVESYELLSLDKSDAYAQMGEWIEKVVYMPKVRKLFSSISLDGEVMEVTYELRNSIDEDYDKGFVENLLANGMVIGWLEPRMMSEKLVRQFFGGREQKYFAQSNHASAVMELYEKARKVLDKDYSRDHGYAAFLIKGGVT